MVFARDPSTPLRPLFRLHSAQDDFAQRAELLHISSPKRIKFEPTDSQPSSLGLRGGHFSDVVQLHRYG
jgi:hypothetical protein